MQYTFERQQEDHLKNAEWIEANGLGGWASSTILGINTRRYHGLLVAALEPPADRMVLVSKLEESVVLASSDNKSETRYELSANQYPGVFHPKGYEHLIHFTRDLFPVFYYQVGSIKLKKTIACVQGENTTLVIYEVIDAKEKFILELLPLYSGRSIHSLTHANDIISKQFYFNNGILRVKNYAGIAEVCISVPGASFQEDQQWYSNFEYTDEQANGFDHHEDLYTHGKFVVELKKGDTLGIILSTEELDDRDALQLFKKEQRRKERLIRNFSWNESMKGLALAVDQFIVKRKPNLKTIIAGYHWFNDSSRNAMIAMPGLCLATERLDDARRILKAFAEQVDEGMLPDHSPEHKNSPHYNSIDSSLWFFYAIYKYYQRSKDKDFLKSNMPVLEEIIQSYYQGTRCNIGVDSDELLTGGQEGVALTWMNAKTGDWVVTPRKGKTVEVNALWYNVLCMMGQMSSAMGKNSKAIVYEMQARIVQENFSNLFWNEEQECLYDFVDGDYKDDAIRPNQLFSVSLPFELFSKDRSEQIVKAVEQHLYTPYGLRSLSPVHQDYKSVYAGNQWERDAAYHQGSVWGFLVGPFIDAIIKVKGDRGKAEAKGIVTTCLMNLHEGAIGTLSEIFDGDVPHAPRGCIAHACTVGEILRVSMDYNLFERPKESGKAKEILSRLLVRH